MAPLLFETLPAVFSFVAVVVLLAICGLLFLTGRRYFRTVSIISLAFAGAVIGEKLTLRFSPEFAIFGIVQGLAAGVAVGSRSRRVGVGLSLAYLAFSVSTNLVSVAYAQYAAAAVLFAYGFLLADLAPTFVACLMASSILLLSGLWIGLPTMMILAFVSVLAGARILATVLPDRFQARSQSAVT